jgi:hypothetical protein
MVVSRWLVMPMAAMSRARRPARGPRGDAQIAEDQISIGIVLDPAGLGKICSNSVGRRRVDLAIGVEEDGAGAGGALIEGEEVFHFASETYRLQKRTAEMGFGNVFTVEESVECQNHRSPRR